MMARRTADDLRSHLSAFEEAYPIPKGYIARLLFVDDCSVPDVVRKVKSIVETNDPGKNVNEGSIRTNLYEFKKLVKDKKNMLAVHWPSLLTLFLEPLPIPIKSLPVASTSSLVGDTSLEPSSSAPVIAPSISECRRTVDDLRSHLSMFQEGYPILKGFIARLLFVNDCSVPDVVRKVKTIVETNDPGKDINEGNLFSTLYVFKKLVQNKRNLLTRNWPSLTTLFLQPLPIIFKSLPVASTSSQVGDTSLEPASSAPVIVSTISECRSKTADDLRSHLSLFEEGYPINKGYIARLLFVDDCSVPDVLKKVNTIVQKKDPGKSINETSLRNNVHRLRDVVKDKKYQLTKQWPSLITLFLEPLPIIFKSLPVTSASSQPEQSSVPTSSRNPESSVLPTFEMLLEPGIPVTSTFLQPVQNSKTINSSFSLMTCKLASPRKLKSDCANCVNKQRTITNMLQKNKHLHQQCRKFKMLYEAEKGNFSLKRLNQKIKRTTESATKWKTRYASLSNACRDTFNLLKLVQSLEQQVKTLEGKLTAAQEENNYMASVNEQLQSLLEKTENGNAYLKQVNEQIKNKLEKAEDDNAHLKRVHEQLKSILVKTEDQDIHMKQVHRQLQSIFETTQNDITHLKNYRQAIHSPDMEIKEEPTWEEHPQISQWKEASVSDESTVTSYISSKDKLCGERCQVKARGDCLDHGPPIYIDNAEMSCEHTSGEDYS